MLTWSALPLINNKILFFFLVVGFLDKFDFVSFPKLLFFLGKELDIPFLGTNSSIFVILLSRLSASDLINTLYIAEFLYKLFLEPNIFLCPEIPSKNGSIK